jgi:copper chaperone CopZ
MVCSRNRGGDFLTMRMQEIIIEVSGMTCPNCEAHVAKALHAVSGVRAVTVDHNEGRAVVTGDPSEATPEKLLAAVVAAGYAPGEVLFSE